MHAAYHHTRLMILALIIAGGAMAMLPVATVRAETVDALRQLALTDLTLLAAVQAGNARQREDYLDQAATRLERVDPDDRHHEQANPRRQLLELLRRLSDERAAQRHCLPLDASRKALDLTTRIAGDPIGAFDDIALPRLADWFWDSMLRCAESVAYPLSPQRPTQQVIAQRREMDGAVVVLHELLADRLRHELHEVRVAPQTIDGPLRLGGGLALDLKSLRAPFVLLLDAADLNALPKTISRPLQTAVSIGDLQLVIHGPGAATSPLASTLGDGVTAVDAPLSDAKTAGARLISTRTSLSYGPWPLEALDDADFNSQLRDVINTTLAASSKD